MVSEESFIAEVGRRVRAEREKRGFTIKDVANMTKISESFLGAVERGQKGTSLYNMAKICEFFSITLNDLVENCGSGSGKTVFRESEEETAEDKREKINLMTYDLSDAQLDILIGWIKDMHVLITEPSKNNK